MIIIIEGINGVGKTTLATSLAASLDGVVHRPFRGLEGHWLAEDIAAWRRIGVDVNTHAEDLYVADALARLPVSCPVILDRSVPSSIAYGVASFDPFYTSDVCEAIFNAWQDILIGCQALWLQLEAPRSIIEARVHPDRLPTEKEHKAIASQYRKMFTRSKLQRRRITIGPDTGKADVLRQAHACIKGQGW